MQKKHLLIGATAISLALTAVSAPSFAAEPRKAGGQRAERMIERLDTNKDSKISPDEFKANISATFKSYDADGNGQVSRDEIKAKREAFREAHKAWREARKTEGDAKAQAREKLAAARPGMLPGAGRMFDRADTDKSGSLSESEVVAAADMMFKRRDHDGDGFINVADLRDGKGRQNREQRAERMLKRLDADNDGKVSQEELLQRASATFQRLDTDGNGEVNKEELKAKRAEFREARRAFREIKATGADVTEAREKLRESGVGMLPGARRFDRTDADKNGAISKTEMETAASDMFKRMDKDGDGFVTKADFETAEK
ncbi:MAG: EF-hand domain-containing protein [Shinella sp.]|nr:EF-hand domain-containing protein [Shinella sp.]